MVRLSPKLANHDDHYILLLPSSGEQILTRSDLLEFLSNLIKQDPGLDNLNFSDPEAQAIQLLETTCELTLESGEIIQWFAIRLEK